MKPLSEDTSPEAQEIVFQLLRDAPAAKKLWLTFDLIQTTRLLVLSGLRQRFPNATDEEIKRHLISKLLPRDNVISAYGFDPNSVVNHSDGHPFIVLLQIAR